MSKALVSIVPITDRLKHHLRLLRNDCRSFMTHSTAEITAVQQDAWWETPARDAMRIVMAFSAEAVPIGFGLVQDIDGKAWLTGGVMGGWRGMGVGRRIFEKIIELALSDHDEVWLDVRATNDAAIKLYESLGFVETSRTDADVTAPFSVIVMVLRP